MSRFPPEDFEGQPSHQPWWWTRPAPDERSRKTISTKLRTSIGPGRDATYGCEVPGALLDPIYNLGSCGDLGAALAYEVTESIRPNRFRTCRNWGRARSGRFRSWLRPRLVLPRLVSPMPLSLQPALTSHWACSAQSAWVVPDRPHLVNLAQRERSLRHRIRLVSVHIPSMAWMNTHKDCA